MATKSPSGPSLARADYWPGGGPRHLRRADPEFKHISKHAPMERAGARRVGTGLLFQINLLNTQGRRGPGTRELCIHWMAHRSGKEKSTPPPLVKNAGIWENVAQAWHSGWGSEVGIVCPHRNTRKSQPRTHPSGQYPDHMPYTLPGDEVLSGTE